MASSTAADIPTTRGRRKQAKPQRKNVDLENLSSDDVVVTSVAASVGGAVAAGDLCAPSAAAMSPDNNHNHHPLADQTPHQDEEQNSRIVSSPPEGETRRIFVGSDPGGAGLQGLLMVKVRKDADDRQGEIEVMGDDSEVVTNDGGTTVTDEVPQRRPMLRRELLGEEEEKMLQECLQRSDTAVIFPEPVEQVPLPAASVGKAISPASGADDGGGAGGVGASAIAPDYFIKCPQCHKGYPGFQALKDHVESSHPPPPHLGGNDGVSQPTSPIGSPAPTTPAGATPGGMYACSQCSTSFLHKDQLEKHELLHSPNAQVSCKVCNKTFANVYRLQRHMISHDESAVLRKFKCPECEKAFKFKHHLKEHIRIHSGEKPFECANCGKRFSHSGSYSSHMTSKKCLVMNLKVGRGGRGGPNSLLDKCPPHHRGAGPASKRSLTNHSPLNNNTSNATTNSSMNNNSFPPMLPKYGDAFLSAVTPRVPSRYPTTTSHPHPAAPNLHPFYMAVAPTVHLNPHPNSGINPYKLPASLSHLLEHLTASSPPHQPRICVAEGNKKMEEVVEEEKENEVGSDTQNQEKKGDGGSKDTKGATEIKEERQVEGDIDMIVPEGEEVRQDEAGERESPVARSRSRNSPGAGSNSGDLEAVKRILETVNATVTKQFLEANMQKLTSSTSSGSSCPSIASLSSPATNGTESNVTEFQKKNSEFSSTSEFLSCRHCQKKFPSPIDLHQHERYLCEHSVGDRRSEGLAAKLEDAVTVKTEEMSLNGGCSGSEDGDDADGRASGKEPGTEEDEYEAESITATDQVSEDGRKVRVRSLIADEQLAVLKGHYSRNPRPKKDELSRIAEKIGFPVRVVQVWFQNTRARDRREGRLVHVPYVPLATVPGFPPASLVPSSQPSHLQTMNVGHYSTTSPPLCPSSGTEQPLDLSTKKTQHSLASSPSSSPLRPTSAAAHSDSGEDVGCAMNLSRKSSSSRSPTPNSSAMLTAPFRQLLPFQQPHYPHSSCSSSSVADFRQTPSPMSSINFQQHIEGLSNGIANGSRLARILAQPPVTASHRMVAGLTNGINGSTVGLVPMERLMYGTDVHMSSRSPLPIFNHQHHLENGRACSSSPSSDKRSWKQGYLDGGDTTDEADDSGCGGGGNQETDHALMMMDDDGSSPNKRHKLSPALNKGLLTNVGGVTGLDGEVEGQFICDQCDKAFSKQSSLARHKYEHSGQRPHKCDVCTKAFKHKHHLTEHKRLHSGEKPFQCSKCLKRFSHSGSYSQHMNHRYSYCKPYRE